MTVAYEATAKQILDTNFVLHINKKRANQATLAIEVVTIGVIYLPPVTESAKFVTSLRNLSTTTTCNLA